MDQYVQSAQARTPAIEKTTRTYQLRHQFTGQPWEEITSKTARPKERFYLSILISWEVMTGLL